MTGHNDVTVPAPHECNAECWAYMLRYGMDENATECDPFAAEAAAHAEALAEGAIS
jgi:hypothetical protein